MEFFLLVPYRTLDNLHITGLSILRLLISHTDELNKFVKSNTSVTDSKHQKVLKINNQANTMSIIEPHFPNAITRACFSKDPIVFGEQKERKSFPNRRRPNYSIRTSLYVSSFVSDSSTV